MSFDRAIEFVLEQEGGYSNDPRDPGKETRWGISHAAYPDEDIFHLTLERAKSIYLRDYWTPIKADQLPDAVAFVLMDAAVNMGVGTAVKCLQRALGVISDGEVGTQTITYAQAADLKNLLAGFCSERIAIYSSLPTWGTYGRGWTNRAVKAALEAPSAAV